MKYQNKLLTSCIVGGLTSFIGIGISNPHVIIAGMGLIIPSYYHLDDIETHQDEFEDLRNEFHKRERLVKRALECYQMHWN